MKKILSLVLVLLVVFSALPALADYFSVPSNVYSPDHRGGLLRPRGPAGSADDAGV